jgi:chitinase
MDANRYSFVRRIRIVAVVLAALGAAVTASAQTAWKARVAYRAGTVVTYQGWTAVCVQEHASQVGWEPPNAPALWSLQGPRAYYAAPSPTAAPRRLTSTPTRVAAVTPTPKAAIANASPLHDEQAEAPTPRPTGPRAWAVNTSYNAGDVVAFGGTTYRCRLLHMAIPGWEPANAATLWSAEPS